MAKVVDSAVAWIYKIECVCDRWNKHTVMDCLAIWDGELVPVNDGGGHFSREISQSNGKVLQIELRSMLIIKLFRRRPSSFSLVCAQSV